MSDADCPYCGKGNNDLWELNLQDGEVIDYDCQHCEKSFKLSCSISVDYTSKRKEKDCEHEWHEYKGYKICNACDSMINLNKQESA